MIDQDLEPEIISVGTSRLLRVKRIGRVFLVENLHYERDVKDGKEIITERWKAVSTARGKNAYNEAHQWLHEANRDILKLIATQGTRPVARAP